MDLGLNEMQEMLKRSAREFLEKECPKSLVRQAEQEPSGYSPDLWQKMAQQGWMGMAVPSQYGGSDTSFLDLAVLYEELGRALVPGPFLDTALSAYLLQDLGSEEQKAQYLPAIARGELIATVALTEHSASYDADAIHLSAKRSGDGFVLKGSKLFISNAHIAGLVLVVARTTPLSNAPPQGGRGSGDGFTVFAVELKAAPPGLRGPQATTTPGIAINPLETMAGDRQSEIVFDEARVPANAVLGQVDGAWPAVQRYLDRAKVLTCVWSVGGAEYVLEVTVEYAKNRVQFGRPIGSFQAVAHRCADMAVDCDGMRFVSYDAAWKLSEGLAADYEVGVAKTWTSEAYRRVTASGHQVHGGVGFMMEHDMQLYHRRAKAAELLFGDADYHRELLARGIGL